MADNVVAGAAVGTGATFVTANLTWSGDAAQLPGSFSAIISGSEGSWTLAQIVGGTGVDGAGVQRVTLATDVALPTGSNTIGAVTVSGSVAITHAALTELAAAINGSSQMDVNIAASGATLTVASHAVTNAGTFPVQATLQDMSAGEYETVAASQTAQVIGATGAAGDWISGLLVIPASTSPGNVLLLDNATSITVFAGGASSVSNLVPFFIPLGIKSVSGAWKVTTGANVSVIAVGNFT